MEWLFGRKKTPEEMLRENQRSLKKAMRWGTLCSCISQFIIRKIRSYDERELDRERAALEKQETKVIIDLKKAAKAGQIVCVPVFVGLICLGCCKNYGERFGSHSWIHQENDPDAHPNSSSFIEDPGLEVKLSVS